MERQPIIENIFGLPISFYADGNVSIYSVLKNTGYFELFDQVTEADILEVIFRNPGCVDSWLQWSADKRPSSGWYFIQNNDGRFDVGHLPKDENFKTREYPAIEEACAAFIKLEIEDIRKLG